MARTIRAADLFCGAGGSSTGLLMASELLGRRVELAAVNHWQRAVETHAANHPRANHFCEDLTTMDPHRAIPSGKLDLLIASPECTHHSVARGGKPMSDQSRASAWCVLRWATALRIDRILIENVREFTTWGPLGTNGRPLKSRRGETFAAFVAALESLGYRVQWRVLNAADYGDATTRQRLYLQAALGRRPIRWPAPSHAQDQRPGLFGTLRPWRAAREVIDWNLSGESIFARKRPLSVNTLRRIEAGLRKFGGANAEPFIVAMNYLSSREHDGRYTRSVGDPVPTITGQGNRFYLAEPYLVNLRGTDPGSLAGTAKPIGGPVPTITGGDHVGLCEPFLMQMSQSGSNGRRMRTVGEPVPTVTTADDLAVVTPFLMHTTHQGGDRVNSIDEPVPTVTGANRGEQALVQPFIMSAGGPEVAPRSTGQPVNTVLTRDHMAVVEPFIVPQFSGHPARSVDRPLGAITTTSRGMALVRPFIVKYNRTAEGGYSVDEPLDTVSTVDRFGIVEPGEVGIDIRFRMLAPHELAGAMGFPSEYKFTGNRGEQVKQIGNAVAVNQAAALCKEMLAE